MSAPEAAGLEPALGVLEDGVGLLEHVRKALGHGGRELGQLFGVTPESVSRWENGKHPIDRQTSGAAGVAGG